MNWYLLAFKNYANFSGRARRKEYWMFILVNILIFLVLALVLRSITDMIGIPEIKTIISSILAIYFIGIIIPLFSLITRRLHDINKSGSYYFIRFIPLIGPIWFIVLMSTEGTKGQNKYGSDPKNPISELDDIGTQ